MRPHAHAHVRVWHCAVSTLCQAIARARTGAEDRLPARPHTCSRALGRPRTLARRFRAYLLGAARCCVMQWCCAGGVAHPVRRACGEQLSRSGSMAAFDGGVQRCLSHHPLRRRACELHGAPRPRARARSPKQPCEPRGVARSGRRMHCGCGAPPVLAAVRSHTRHAPLAPPRGAACGRGASRRACGVFASARGFVGHAGQGRGCGRGRGEARGRRRHPLAESTKPLLGRSRASRSQIDRPSKSCTHLRRGNWEESLQFDKMMKVNPWSRSTPPKGARGPRQTQPEREPGSRWQANAQAPPSLREDRHRRQRAASAERT